MFAPSLPPPSGRSPVSLPRLGAGSVARLPSAGGQASHTLVGWDDMVLVVKGLGDKRGSATIAQGLYEETMESAKKRAERAANRKLMKDPALEIKARPTKRDRRVMDDFKWGEE